MRIIAEPHAELALLTCSHYKFMDAITRKDMDLERC